MQLEIDFFSAAGYAPPARPVTLLVVDFDDTCTAQDTTSMIARAAVHAAAARAADPAAAAEGEARLQWLVQNYLARRGALLDEILPFPSEDEAEEFDMAWLGDFLDRLSDFDREMNGVVVDSGILAGVKRGALTETGARVGMRPGCLATLRRAVDAGVPTAVVSVNWSGEMVAAALAQQGLPVVMAGGGGGTRAGVGGAPPPPGAVAVYANELEYFGDASTGAIKRRCECAADKGRIFEDLLLGLAAEGQAAEGGVSVYVGDSMTDIPALISADVGMLLGSNALVRQVAAAAGVPLRPLPAYPVDPAAAGAGDAGDVPVMYEAASWAEIDAFLFGPAFRPAAPRTPTSRELSALSSGRGAAAHPPRVLSIAGSDSGGGAGIQADIKACAAAGVYIATAVTALTAQNTHGVSEVHPTPPDFIRAQIRAVMGDIGADAIKTGMLPSVEAVEAVADELTAMGYFPPLVVDPVLVATSGDALAEAGVAAAVAGRLFPLATIVTPNVAEAEALLGGRPIADVEDMRAAAADLHALGPQWVLVKGGHLAGGGGAGGGRGPDVVDVLYDGKNFFELAAPHVATDNAHGTGCTLAAALAAALATGADVPAAVRTAKAYVWRALERSVGLPLGSGPQRPMNHAFRVADWRSELEAAAAATAAAADSAVPPAPSPPRLPNPVDLRLYAVTDPALIEAVGLDVAAAVEAAVAGGATVVQLREKTADGGAFAERAAAAAAVCRAAGVPLIINDRVDVALTVDAAGVHVGQDDLPAGAVRRLIGPDKILGVSVKTPEEAVAAAAAGADYLGAGCISATGTKESSVIGIQGFAAVAAAVGIPVVAIGGVGPGSAAEVVAAGGAGIAVVSAIFGARSPRAAAEALRAEVDAALATAK